MLNISVFCLCSAGTLHGSQLLPSKRNSTGVTRADKVRSVLILTLPTRL